MNLNENTREDVLDCLRAIDVPPVLPPAAEPEQEVEDEPLPEVTFARSDEPLLTPVMIERPGNPNLNRSPLLLSANRRRLRHLRPLP